MVPVGICPAMIPPCNTNKLTGSTQSTDSSMDDIGSPYVGRSLSRREDHRLLTGQGQFVADLVLPRMLHAVMVRSPVAHARIRSIDLSLSVAAPGVVCALSGAELARLLPRCPRGSSRCTQMGLAHPTSISDSPATAVGG